MLPSSTQCLSELRACQAISQFLNLRMNSFAHTDLLAAAFAGVLQKHPSLFHPRGKLACKQSALYRLPS